MNEKNLVVEVSRRDTRGSNASRRLRREGFVPAIVYGMGLDPFAVTVAARRVDEVLHSDAGRNAIFQLSLTDEGKTQSRAAMIRDLTRDPVTSRVTHVDFLRVDLDKVVHVSVPVRPVGDAPGVKIGGLLEIVHRDLHVECLPGDIPEHLDIDVSALDIGGQVHVRDMSIPSAVKVLDDADLVVLHVVAPHVEAQAAPAAGEAPAPAAEAGETPSGEES